MLFETLASKTKYESVAEKAFTIVYVGYSVRIRLIQAVPIGAETAHMQS